MGQLDHVRERIRRAYTAMRVARETPPAGRRADPVDPADPVEVAPPAEVPLLAEVAPLAGTAPMDSDGAATASAGSDPDVPRSLRVATAWAWRLLILAGAAALVLWLVSLLKGVLIPLSIALLLSALLAPSVSWLRRAVRLPRSLAVAVVLIAGIAVVGGVLTLVVTQFVSSFSELAGSATDGIRTIQRSLRNRPLHLSNDQLNGIADAAQRWLDTHRDALTTGALTTATTAVDVLASALLVLFTTFFFLRDGRRIWEFVVGLLPAVARDSLAAAGEAGWATLVAYVRATVLVAFIDAVGIGLGLSFLRVQLAFPLAALVFLGAFVPIVGATVSGAVAILVALVTDGWVSALVVLAIVVGVQQLEGHVLQPLIMGRAVAIHPLAVIVAIATGLILAGIIGALVAVPIVAVLNTGIRSLLGHHHHEPEPDGAVAPAESS